MPNTVHIGNVIRHAIVFNFRKPDAEVMNAEALLEAVDSFLSYCTSDRLTICW